MRYVQNDKEIHIKCNHCKKVSIYNKKEFEKESNKVCVECGKKLHCTLWTLKKFYKKYRLNIVFLGMMCLILVILSIQPLKQYYYFNKAVTALNPMVTSILIPVLCSLITLIPMLPFEGLKGKIIDKLPGKFQQILGLVIEFLILVFALNIVIGIHYRRLQISNPETGELQQYFGNAVEKSASGNGRLFDSQGNLIYIGEFKNNLYDGYGKKYSEINYVHNTDVTKTYQCIYEGDFKDGLPDGQGREYQYDAEYDFEKEKEISPYLRYEGEFIKGKYFGYGILYGTKEKYQGVFFDGIYHGYGDLWIKDSNSELTFKMEGVFINGKLNGAGKKYRADGSIVFDGEYENDNMIDGILYYENGMPNYEGKWKNDTYEGEGKEYWKSGGVKYDGSWKENQRNGDGTSYREDGTKEYEGYWKDNSYNGYGKLYDKDGETVQYEGWYTEGQRNSYGVSYSGDKVIEYDGNWNMGKWDGRGKWYWQNGKIYYDGDFKDGKQHGKGISYWNNGEKRYDGEWENGEYSGKGIQFNEKGEMLYDGYFKEGKIDEDKKDK